MSGTTIIAQISLSLKIICADSTETFEKLSSTSLTHHMLKSIDPYFAGVSDKRCLLSLFFILNHYKL